MAGTWELICHHTYAGTPGVVFDCSPLHASHGTAVNLPDGDFLTDGAAPGAGSVSFHRANGFVHVPGTAPAWQSLGAIKGEITLRREPAVHGFMIGGNTFQFYVRSDMLNAWFSSTPTQYAQINSAWDPAGGQPYLVPTGRWLTLGFLHDGFGRMELYADGEVVARKQGTYHPVNAPGPQGIAIGNALSGGAQLAGEIDEVKIWRLNPRRFDEEFLGRPADRATAECWRRYRHELSEALQRHPDCARYIAELIQKALDYLHRRAQAAGPQTEARLAELQAKYRKLWRKGKIGGTAMAEVLAAIVALLRSAGVPLESDPVIAELTNAECLQRIQAELKPLECDRQAIKLLGAIGNSLRSGRPDRETTA